MLLSVIGLKEFDVRYVGWAGIHVSDEAEQKSLTEVLTEKVISGFFFAIFFLELMH